MIEKKSNRGGKREGAGRPRGTRNKVVTVRVSPEAYSKLERFGNKSRYINNLILGDE